jgi:hypothetical protein
MTMIVAMGALHKAWSQRDLRIVFTQVASGMGVTGPETLRNQISAAAGVLHFGGVQL